MTPEAIRLVAKLRHEFYSLFAAAMNVPVRISVHSYSGNFPIAYWVDAWQQLNYLSVYAHSAPDTLFPLRPFLLRVAINKGAGPVTFVKSELKYRDLNQGWHFELTVLPEEIIDFLPWMVSLVNLHDQVSLTVLQSPPHPLKFIMPAVGSYNNAWTEKAWSQSGEAITHSTGLKKNLLTWPKSSEAETSHCVSLETLVS